MAAVVRLLPSIRPQMASLTRPLLIFQRALCGHHLEKSSRGKNWWGGRVLLRSQRQGRLAKIAAKYSLNNRFPNTSSGEVGWKCSPGAHQQWVSEWVSSLVNIICWKFLTHIHPYLTPPSVKPSSLFTLLSISSLISPFPHPPHPSLRPSLPFRVQRPESNLQQLSKSGMTDKLIFSSWVYIPGIWAADLAPNKRRVSASCLLKLMFSWPKMNYPVTRIYLYSS